MPIGPSPPPCALPLPAWPILTSLHTLSLGRLCQRSSRTVSVSVLCVGPTQRRAMALAVDQVRPSGQPHSGSGDPPPHFHLRGPLAESLLRRGTQYLRPALARTQYCLWRTHPSQSTEVSVHPSAASAVLSLAPSNSPLCHVCGPVNQAITMHGPQDTATPAPSACAEA